MAAISLQRQRLINQPLAPEFKVNNGHNPYLYLLPGSHGFAPIAKHWREFLKWYAALPPGYKPLVGGLRSSQW